MPCAEPSTLRGISLPQTAFVPCVQKGANYALVVGDKVYTLDTKDQAVSAELNKLGSKPKLRALPTEASFR